MASNFLLRGYNTADTAVASIALNALGGSGSYALGAAIDNSTDLFPLGDLEIILSSGVIAGSTAPFLGVFLLPSMDGGTIYPTPPGGSAGATSTIYSAGMYPAVASTSVTVMHVPRILLTQFFKIMIVNSLGVALPSTNTSTCKLRRYGFQGT